MLEQLEVMLKMNWPDFVGLVEALKGRSSKSVGFKPLSLGILKGSKIKRLWMFGLYKWKITFMLLRLGGNLPWNLFNPI